MNDKRVDPDTVAASVLFGDPAAVGAQDSADRAGTTAAVPAWAFVGGFRAALGQFLGSTKGLSASTITRLTETWQAEARAFGERDFYAGVDYVYLWADGIHVNVRLDKAKLCLLVLIGVRADRHKETITLSNGCVVFRVFVFGGGGGGGGSRSTAAPARDDGGHAPRHHDQHEQ